MCVWPSDSDLSDTDVMKLRPHADMVAAVGGDGWMMLTRLSGDDGLANQ